MEPLEPMEPMEPLEADEADGAAGADEADGAACAFGYLEPFSSNSRRAHLPIPSGFN